MKERIAGFYRFPVFTLQSGIGMGVAMGLVMMGGPLYGILFFMVLAAFCTYMASRSFDDDVMAYLHAYTSDEYEITKKSESD